jgi:DNA polymerase-1
MSTLPGYIHPETGRIHTSFNQVGAATGRLSSADPNLQNILVRTERGESIRRAHRPAGCQLLVVDYSQIELRLLAHLSGDSAFVTAFERATSTARRRRCFGVAQDQVTPEMRARAKTINFATIYGQGPFALARQLGITQDEARRSFASISSGSPASGRGSTKPSQRHGRKGMSRHSSAGADTSQS